jgi:hypothetical protein
VPTSNRVSSSLTAFFVVRFSTPASSMMCCVVGFGVCSKAVYVSLVQWLAPFQQFLAFTILLQYSDSSRCCASSLRHATRFQGFLPFWAYMRRMASTATSSR